MDKVISSVLLAILLFPTASKATSAPQETAPNCPVQHKDMCHINKAQQTTGCEYGGSKFMAGAVVNQGTGNFRCQPFMVGNGRERFVWVPLNIISVGSMDWRN